jgi:toxin ParE1/3/4
MRLEILREAELELSNAIAYYEEIQPGLGLGLKREAWQCIRWIRENPTVPRLRPKGYRRVKLKRFPYYAAYFVWNDIIWVLAIAHVRRRPEYWMDRKKNIG